MAMDHISQLPEEIKHHILSFLSMKDSIKTSVLSKRWRYQWTFNPNLDFHFNSNNYSSYQGYYEVSAINRCINLYKPKQLHRLHINLNLQINPSKHIEAWIDFAAQRNVQQLNVTIELEHNEYFKIPLSLLLCQSIQILRMKSCIFSPPSDFKGFPTLKILYLNRAKVEDCSTLYSLLSNCPCLQRLGLLDCKFIKCLKVKTIPSLRILSVSGIEHVEISNAPNLRYIQCSGYLQKLLVDNAPSLVTVDISLASFVRGTQPVQQVIKDLRPSIVSFSHVQFLSVGTYFPQLIYAECYLQRGEPIVFKNLKQFKLDGKIIDNLTLYAIVNFFSGCPVLENVTIDVRFPCLHGAWISEFMEKECVQGRLRHGFSDYLMYNLKTVRLNGFSGRAEEMMLIKVLFDKAIVLEELFLYSMMACTTGEYELLQRLPKGSSSAKIIMENGLRLKYF